MIYVPLENDLILQDHFLLRMKYDALNDAKLTHLPTSHLQPTMQLSSQECELTCAPFKIVHLLIQTPSSMTTSGPMVTFGPILQFAPIFALGS